MRALGLAFYMMSAVAFAVGEPPLPTWDSEQRDQMLEDGWIAGGSLLSFEALSDAETSEDTIRRQVGVGPEDLIDEESNENDVSEEYLVEYFAARPSGHLVDPQGLLSSREKADLEAFLGDHAGESSIDMFVYAFGGNQEIPSDVREEEVVERLYSVGKPAVIVYYYLGAPQRTTIYLSPIVTDEVSAAEQRRAVESSVIRAFNSTDPAEQLEAFLVQMSIRIYWMERIAEGTAVETKAEISNDEPAAMVANVVEPELHEPIPSWVRIASGAGVALVGFGLFFWSGLMWLRKRARFVFPEFDVEPRLDANHAAGIGAVISFASSAVPPASQRDQVPDYMRRA